MKKNNLLTEIAVLVTLWVAACAILFFCNSCDGTAPPMVIKQPSQAPAKCEQARAAALAHVTRCDGPVNYVCIPPELLQPCSHAVHVDEGAFDRCMAYLTDMRPCSYVAFGCDWEGIFTFTTSKSRSMPIGTPVEKCEAMAQRARERGLAITSLSDVVVCVHPERLLPCSRAAGVSDDWDACMVSLVTDGAGKNSCPQDGLVIYE